MKGVSGRIAVVELTKGSWHYEQLPEEIYEKWLGGKGLGTWLISTRIPAGADALGPDNALVLAIGPAAASPIWGGCRHGFFTKSPLTGGYAETYSGGKAAEAVAAADIDALVITGKAEGPVWLEVSEDGVAIHRADDLWGMDTYQAEAEVLKRMGPGRRRAAMVIGPAGERGVRFAVIENDRWRSAGRTGAGAVMGSKNIKAIAVRGSATRPIAEPAAARDFAKALAAASKDNPGVAAYKSMGTPMMVDILNKVASFPTRYWSRGTADHREEINATALHSRCEVRPHACLKCFIACGRLSTVKGGKYGGLTIEGPEYETIYAFGGLCEVGTIEEIAYLNDICDRLGMDTITAGNLVGLAIASGQGGVEYGDTEGIARLLEDIAYGRGLGEVLGRGIKEAAEELGARELAVHVKGLEPAGYDPRVLKGMALAYAVSDRGACHLRATFYKPELSGMVDPEQIEGKAKIFTEWEDRLTIFDCLILCRFYRDLYQWDELSRIIRLTTGLELDTAGMRAIAAHVTDLTRCFNLREGLSPEDDRLPIRLVKEALADTGKSVTEEQVRKLVEEYYQARGWDAQGRPQLCSNGTEA